jgi:hypothetical protein
MVLNNGDRNSLACIVYVIAVMPSFPRGQQVRPAWPAWLTPLCAGPVAFELQSRAIVRRGGVGKSISVVFVLDSVGACGLCC